MRNLKLLDFLRTREGNILVTNFTHWPKYIGISLYLLQEIQKFSSARTVFYINWINNVYPEHISAWIPINLKQIKKRVLNSPIEKFLNINEGIQNIEFDENYVTSTFFDFDNFKPEIDWIKNLEVDGFNVGESILSSYSKSFGVQSNNLWDKFFIRKLLRTYSNIYFQVIDQIKRNNITCIFIFNGRFIYERAAINAARKLGIKVFYYESGGNLKDGDIYSHDTHDRSLIQERMSESAKDYHNSDLERLGRNWFESNARTGIFVAWFSKIYFKIRFREHKDKKKIIYYTSSEDELAWIGDNWKSTLGSQEECIGLLADICKINNLLLVVKIHPNILTKNKNDKRYLLKYLKNRNSIIIIRPHKIFNSYILMNFADLIVNYNSTIGIEAAYRNKKVICLAPTLYDSFGATFECRTREKFENYIQRFRTNELKPLIPLKEIYIYGTFMMLRGFKITNFFLPSDSFLIFQGLKFGVEHRFNRAFIHLLKIIENLCKK